MQTLLGEYMTVLAYVRSEYGRGRQRHPSRGITLNTHNQEPITNGFYYERSTAVDAYNAPEGPRMWALWKAS